MQIGQPRQQDYKLIAIEEANLHEIAILHTGRIKNSILPQIRNFVYCGLMGWDLIRLVMPMAGIELQIAADVHSCPLPHDAA